MSNAPAWLRCENCLWFVGDEVDADFYACHYDWEKVIKRDPFSRCSEWRCRRCFDGWCQDEDNPVNHMYCKIIARKKPVEGEK